MKKKVVKKDKSPRLIYLEWHDAIAPIEGWRTTDEVLEWAKNDDYWVSQVGWILEENKRYLVLSSQMNTSKTETYSNQFAHVIKIPKTWIRKRLQINISTSLPKPVK